MTSIITISKPALNAMKNILNANKNEFIFFGLKTGGCNGFNYIIKPTNSKPEKNDEVIIYDNIKVNVCGSSLMYLLGTHIDWHEDYMGNRFVFDNPLTANKCGCGTSFNTNI